MVHVYICGCMKDRKLQLCEYTWSIVPKECSGCRRFRSVCAASSAAFSLDSRICMMPSVYCRILGINSSGSYFWIRKEQDEGEKKKGRLDELDHVGSNLRRVVGLFQLLQVRRK